MDDLVIRRVAATAIDYYIFNFVYGLIGMCRLLSNFTMMTNPLTFLKFMKNYSVWLILMFVIYCFILDCFVKLDLGKLKILSCVLFPISIAYYIIHKKMIYDEYLGITIRDKNMR